MKTSTKIDLNVIKKEYAEFKTNLSRRIVICTGTGCVANGSIKVRDAFARQIIDRGLPISVYEKRENENSSHAVLVSGSGCQGFCQMGPLVTIEPDGILYCKVQESDVAEIVEHTLIGHQTIERLLYHDPNQKTVCKGAAEIPFYAKQQRTVLRDCGIIDPGNIAEYIYLDGYTAAEKAYSMMTSKDVCDTIARSGMRGRGGGGFPTGRKWELTRVQLGPKKYVICNGDEGDPGAFMDRSVMEGNPHSVIEGMMIAARAVGADEGYVYVRAEYPLAVRRVRQAVEDALRLGILGNNIFGSGMAFNLHVMEGAGAFVCGEETALIASIEGKRGMPNPKPPFPAQSGLWSKPTVINNVETLASIPLIIRKGPEQYCQVGTQGSPGTKTFALTGHVVNTGLIEVPLGTPLREIIYDIGGGVTDDFGNPIDEPFKAVQIGGPSGGCLTQDHLDLPLDFDSLCSVGAMVGSGGLVVMNQNTCMVKIAHFFMQFTQNESCGKCVLCREGTRQMLRLLEDIMEGRADENTLKLLEQLAGVVGKGSLCGLGKTAPSPVLSTLRYFRDEYEAHVYQKRCPSDQCQALRRPEIIAALCKGCTACMRKCPVGAISGKPREVHVLDAEKCIKCGACAAACKFEAIKGV